jgi:hypothetical protein
LAAGFAASTGLGGGVFALMGTSLACTLITRACRAICAREADGKEAGKDAGATGESPKHGSEDPPLRGGRARVFQVLRQRSGARAMLYF